MAVTAVSTLNLFPVHTGKFFPKPGFVTGTITTLRRGFCDSVHVPPEPSVQYSENSENPGCQNDDRRQTTDPARSTGRRFRENRIPKPLDITGHDFFRAHPGGQLAADPLSFRNGKSGTDAGCKGFPVAGSAQADQLRGDLLDPLRRGKPFVRPLGCRGLWETRSPVRGLKKKRMRGSRGYSDPRRFRKSSGPVACRFAIELGKAALARGWPHGP